MNKEVKFNIKGMHCASCSRLIEMSLKDKKGIENPSVDLLTNSASMILNDSEISSDDIIKIIDSLGFKAEPTGVNDHNSLDN